MPKITVHGGPTVFPNIPPPSDPAGPPLEVVALVEDVVEDDPVPVLLVEDDQVPAAPVKARKGAR